MKHRRLRGAGLRNWRKWLVLVLIVFLFAGITAHAFSGIGKDHWSSKLEKGEYRGDGNAIEATVDEDYTSPDETYENEKSPHHVFVIVSESQQILVVTPDEPDKKDAGAETVASCWRKAKKSPFSL